MSTRTIFIFAVLLLSALTLRASGEVYLSSLRGSSIEEQEVLEVEDGWYSHMRLNSDWADHPGNALRSVGFDASLRFTNVKSDGLVSLRWEGSDGDFFDTDWSYDITVSVKGYDSHGNLMGTELRELHIDYSYGSNDGHHTNYKDWDLLRIPGAHRLEVEITDISYFDGTNTTSPTAVDGIYGDLLIEASVEVERYFSLEQSNALTLSQVSLNTSDRMVEYGWSYEEGAEEYDFEWLYVSDYVPGGVQDWSKASRVTLSSQHYSLELPYESGMLYFRVRAVGIGNQAGQRIYGVWSAIQSLSIANSGGDIPPFSMDWQNDEDKNWTYGASYAEEGKRSEVLTFFDGTGRARQSVSKDNSTGRALIGENIYDHEGRQALVLAPTPHAANHGRQLRFYENYNVNTTLVNGSPVPFSKEDFDLDHHYGYESAPVAVNPLSASSGSAAYYSDNNVDNNNYRAAYIADAQALPYTRTSFDNRGRPQRIGGLGTELAYGGDHDMRYIYGNVMEGELERFFGAEVGYAEHYKKEMIRDANGQWTVSYKNLSGNVVLTAMLGDPPRENSQDMVEAVDDHYRYDPSEPMSSDLTTLNRYEQEAGSASWTVEQLLTPMGEGNYDFSWSFDPESYSGCKSGDCDYAIEFHLYDDEGQEVALQSSQTSYFINLSTAGLLNGVPTDLSQPLELTGGSTTATVDFTLILGNNGLEYGRYTLVKKLRLLNGAEKFQSWYTDLLSQLASGGGSCLTASGTSVLPDPDCFEENTVLGEDGYCIALKETLLQDVSPGGQYFDNVPPNSGNSPNDNWLNTEVASSSSGIEALGFDYYHTSLGMTITASSWSEVRTHWEDDWAETLVLDHPEYCHYQNRCPDPSGWDLASRQFDISLQQMDYATAVSNEYINQNTNYYYPEEGNSSVALTCTTTTKTYLDGAYALLSDESSQNSLPLSIRDGLREYLCTYPDASNSQTMLEVASDPTGNSGITDEQVWDRYVSMYITMKRRLIDEYYETTYPGCAYLTDGDPNDYEAYTSSGFAIRVSQSNTMVEDFMSQSGMTDPMDYVTNMANNSMQSNSLCDYQQGEVRLDICGCGTCPTSDPATLELHLSGSTVYTLSPNLYTTLILCDVPLAVKIATIKADIEATIAGLPAPYHNMRIYVEEDNGQLVFRLRVPQTEYSWNGSSFSSTTPHPDFASAQLVMNLPGSEDPSGGFSSASCAQEYPVCNCEEIQRLLDDEDLELRTTEDVVNYYVNTYFVEPGEDLTTAIEMCTGVGEGSYPRSFSDLEAYETFVSDLQALLPAELHCDPFSNQTSSCTEVYGDLQTFYDQQANWRELQEVYANLQAMYFSDCMLPTQSGGPDEYEMNYVDRRFHVMLYYYDVAGNLVRTVSPTGVNDLMSLSTPATISDAKSDRLLEATDPVRPAHGLVTSYEYNTVGAVLKSHSPDRGDVLAYYDELVRSRASQDAQQRADQQASYVLYDELGRLIESGVITAVNGYNLNNYLDNTTPADFNNNNFPNNLVDVEKSEVRKVYYNEHSDNIANIFSEGQQNLRNRVSLQTYAPDGSFADYKVAYSYDIHGNAKEMWQYQSYLQGNTYKQLEYDYDLISGAVQQVDYQKGRKDQLSHRYGYDALNRIVKVETSQNGYIWNQDAKYYYYAHGPLRRMEIGEDKVQGLDYVYTLQGWVKSVNSSTLDPQADPGRDGVNSPTLHSSIGSDIHQRMAEDVYGYGVHYYATDYSPIHNLSLTDPVADLPGTYIYGLYNGNISSVTQGQTNPAVNGQPQKPLDLVWKEYRYDQLHRIKSSTVHQAAPALVQSSNSWQGVSSTTGYETAYTYDANGNILTLTRNQESGSQLDNLVYRYENGSGGTATVPVVNNRLNYVEDQQTTNPETYDLKTQPVNNYRYTEDGSLERDVEEDIARIIWTAENKVKEVIRTTGSNKPDLEYVYDFQGNRMLKIVKPAGSNVWDYTHYVRDARGNVMSVYTYEQNSNAQRPSEITVLDPMNHPHTYLKEQMLYGTTRLGIIKRDVLVSGPITVASDGTGVSLESTEDLTLEFGLKSGMHTLESGQTSTYAEYVEGDELNHVADLELLDQTQKEELKYGGGLYVTNYMVIQRLERLRGQHRYEISNFRADMRQVISDIKVRICTTGVCTSGVSPTDRYVADVYEVNDAYPFGWQLPERQDAAGGENYRFGFNGKENDKDWGSQLIQDYGFRLYNPAIGKFLSVDPVNSNNPNVSPYQFARNSPIIGVDLAGLDFYYAADGSFIGKYGKGNNVRVITDNKMIGYAKKVVGTKFQGGTAKMLYDGSDLLKNEKGGALSHEHFLDRVHWHYGENGGSVVTKDHLAYAILGHIKVHGDEDVYENAMKDKTRKGRSDFFEGNVGDENYDLFTALRRSGIENLEASFDDVIDLAFGERDPDQVAFYKNYLKEGIRSNIQNSFKATIDAATNKSQNPWGHDRAVSWSKSLKSARTNHPDNLSLTGFTFYSEANVSSFIYFHEFGNGKELSEMTIYNYDKDENLNSTTHYSKGSTLSVTKSRE